MKSAFNVEHFASEEAAIEYVEGRLWPDGSVCPHCGVVGEATKLKGKSTRPGLWKCRVCRKPFTVRMRTIFESSHIPLHKWFQAAHLLASSKKGISAHQMHRTLKVTYKTAWFMCHRLREAMRDGELAPMGGSGNVVEIDETFYGQVKGEPKRRGTGHKHVVLSLIERGGKRARQQAGQNDCAIQRRNRDDIEYS